jgi:transposase
MSRYDAQTVAPPLPLRLHLSAGAADVMGKSCRDKLDALVPGETDPEVLAQLARRQMRKKIPALREAWAGHFDEHHRLWIGAILAHIDFLDAHIERLSDAIEEQLRPLAPAVELLCTVVGIQRRGAQTIVAEIGADMTRFPTARHLASCRALPSPDAVHRRDLPRPRRRLLHPNATPNARPSASSNSSNASTTPSGSTKEPRQPERSFLPGTEAAVPVAGESVA